MGEKWVGSSRQRIYIYRFTVVRQTQEETSQDDEGHADEPFFCVCVCWKIGFATPFPIAFALYPTILEENVLCVWNVFAMHVGCATRHCNFAERVKLEVRVSVYISIYTYTSGFR